MRVRGAEERKGPVRRFVELLVVLFLALTLTAAFFLVLPLIQAIARGPGADLVVQPLETADLPPPPPAPEEEPEEEEEEPPPPPKLADEAPPPDLAQLDLVLGSGFSAGIGGGDFVVNLGSGIGKASDENSLFSLADLDQKPRAVYQPGPVLDAKLRKKIFGTVRVIFVVNEQGKVEDATVQSSADPQLESAALSAVKKWKFEPGKRQGKPVRFRMRVPITFPEG